MPVAWRVTKKRRLPYDGTDTAFIGGRWHSPGRPVIHASDTCAGAILEILAHSLRPRALPGPHHAVRIDMPDDVVERLDDASIPGWYERGSAEARDLGDRCLGKKGSSNQAPASMPRTYRP
jgi:RES domain-containing protein